jgi:hypothetical protein
VEGDGGDLEAEAHDQQDHRQQQDGVLQPACVDDRRVLPDAP